MPMLLRSRMAVHDDTHHRTGRTNEAASETEELPDICSCLCPLPVTALESASRTRLTDLLFLLLFLLLFS
jgi:hypothetical protein